MIDAGTLLTQLIDAGEQAIKRPQLAAQDEPMLALLRDQVEAECKRPADGERLIGDEDHLLAQALAMHARNVGGKNGAGLQQVIGVLLPIVRLHFGRALEARRRGPATTDQDYVKPTTARERA